MVGGRRWETSSRSRSRVIIIIIIIISLTLLLLQFLPHFTLAADEDPLQCLLALAGVEGCFNAVHRAAVDRRFKELGHPCCQAVTGLGDYCWPIIFPCRPLLPMLLKTICKFVPPIINPDHTHTHTQIIHHHHA